MWIQLTNLYEQHERIRRESGIRGIRIRRRRESRLSPILYALWWTYRVLREEEEETGERKKEIWFIFKSK